MFAFYAALVARALWSLPSSLGSNLLGLVWPVVIVLCGEIIACLVYGWRAMIFKWKSASMIGLAALGVCYTLLFLWCGLLENYQDHIALASDNAKLKAANDSATYHEAVAVLMAKNECAEIAGVNETLDKQNRDQQDTINNCQDKALALLVPEKRRITPLLLENTASGFNKENQISSFLVLTNKTVTPIRLVVQCDHGFALAPSDAIVSVGAGPVVYRQSRLGDGVRAIDYDAPAWTPVSPLKVTIDYVSKTDIVCSFQER